VLDNTLELAVRLSPELRFGAHALPRFPVPDGESEASMLRRQAEAGLEARLAAVPLAAPPERYRERLGEELAVIERMGFSGYFLIVAEFIGWARAQRIPVGPGRGSGAGSLVAWALRITDLDPLRFDLLFERFLNPGRKSMPDIDIDFAVEGRDRVINYVAERYGRDRVAQIITFSTMAARAAIRDAGRVLDIPYGVVDRIAKLVPEGPGQTLADALKPGSELAQAVERDPVAKEIVELARPLEGLTRADSIHAAGVVIGAQPLIEVVPLQQKGADQEVVTQLKMGDVEALGLLKMDFLGLRNLDVIEKAAELAGGVDVSAIPLDDAETYAMLARGDSIGVFQFESSGMREALRQVRPTRFEDLIALVALYRPGPMGYISTYAARKHGREPVTFLDPRLEPITGETYAICVYQEQYMEIAKRLAGFTPQEADDLRKAIGKKIHALMASLREKFLDGCAANGVAPAVARQLWDDMEKAQDYSFNKSHAACYALIAYRTAWLKAHHPREYMAALISSVMNTKDRVPFYVNACREMGIEVLPPDVNYSQSDFAVVEGKIRFGLNAVRNVGEAAAQAIVRAREEGGPFTSIWDLVERVDPQHLNRRALESLVRSGALGSTGATRKGLLDERILDAALAHGARQQQDRLVGQASIFDDLGGAAAPSLARQHPSIAEDELDERELLRLEKETLGIYVSDHPLEGVRDELARKTDCPLSELERRRDGEVVTVGGIVSALRQVTTKRGEPLVFATLEDPTGVVEVVVFNSTYAAAREHLEVDVILVVKGRVDHKQAGETKLVALEVSPFEAAPARRDVRLRIDARAAPAGLVRQLADLVREYPGDAAVVLELETSSGARTLALGPAYRVQPSSDFFAEVKALLGETAVV
ncbi:MAG: DNA polymerase III subunit alpha, partial [Gaiellaceae bacterium]|nr:DNA polymerase III subunit alpha [Gaiellaceae bacterium]